jgi:flagellar basal body-associated protein FliL
MRIPLCCLASACTVVLAGGEAAVPAQGQPQDPAQAVIAEGQAVYRQRDLDALLLVALRHARAREFAADGKPPLISRSDEERIRQVVIQALTAREAFAAVLGALPEQVPPAARDAIALDLLAWKAEPNPAATPPAAAAPQAGPALVRLPPFTITRAIDGQGRRQLTLGLALAFADAATAQALEARAPLIQDAVLGALRGLGPSIFLDPDHAELKRTLSEAVRAKIPEFPVDGLLIPQLETGPADAPTER